MTLFSASFDIVTSGLVAGPKRESPDGYSVNMPRTFVLCDEITVQAPVERCFLLSTNSELVAMTLKMTPAMQHGGAFVRAGDRVRWRGWQLGLPQFHESLIDPFEPPVYFRDSMLSGRFAAFAHDHHLMELEDSRVKLRDEVRFQMPLGWLGGLLRRCVLVPPIRALLRKRFALLKSLAESDQWRAYIADEVEAG
jgi:ligand-binding SRPBCC domain-containing protein